MIKIIFKMIMYTFFGMSMELLSSGLKYGWKENDDRPLFGDVSLLMVPFYAIVLTFVWDNYYQYLLWIPTWIRFTINATIFLFIEYLLGFVLNKYFNIRLWDYSEYYDCIGDGYSRASLWAMWGWCSLWLESYSGFLNFVSKFAELYFF